MVVSVKLKLTSDAFLSISLAAPVTTTSAVEVWTSVRVSWASLSTKTLTLWLAVPRPFRSAVTT